jgi:hypothetical protein
MENSPDTIRDPDSVFNEQLLEDNRSEFDKQIDEALYVSLQESQHLNSLNIQYEEEIIRKFEKECVDRREKFTKFLLELNKLIRFDKDVKEIYQIIEPIIEAYCNQFIEICEFDEVTYNKIFKTLSTIRIDQNCIDLLKNIIITN